MDSGSLSSFYDELLKIAGELDVAAMERFTKGLRPGDLIQFEAQAPDVMRASLRRGTAHQLISKPIQTVTGSPQHHTAMYVGTDPKTGQHLIAHSYEQGGRAGVVIEPVDKYGRSVKLHALRPSGVTPQQAASAAEEAKVMAFKPTSYSTRNLLGAGVYELGEKAPRGRMSGALKRMGSMVVGRVCDPGTGICSQLPTDAYSRVLGKVQAVRQLVGEGVSSPEAHVGITPGRLARSPTMQSLGTYAPAKPEASTIRAAGGRLKDLMKSVAKKVVTRGH